MITVFTPSHDTRFLDEAYQSLLAQTHEDWEWQILLNGPAAKDEDNAWRIDDPRVHIRFLKGTHGVGELKRRACNGANGDILVEFDHDDILLPDALAEVRKAFDDNPDVVFVYSHFAQVNEDGSRNDDRFDASMGWHYSEHEGLLQCHSFEPYPSVMGYIWFAPNHVRSFRKSAYEGVGGYNESLDILDDQELMARLYIAGEFHMIDRCLYLQRVHGGNTQVRADLNARIQSETVVMYDSTISDLAVAWSKRNGLRAIDLGAAHNKAPGFEALDQYAAPGVDIVADVTQGLPFEDNSVGVIRAADFLEHIPDKVALMNECYRVLAHGGMLLSLTPSTDGRGAFQDPTHVAFWNENSFWYYIDGNLRRFVPEIQTRFQESRLTTYFPSPWHQQHQISYVCANLVAIKDGPRLPGELKI